MLNNIYCITRLASLNSLHVNTPLHITNVHYLRQKIPINSLNYNFTHIPGNSYKFDKRSVAISNLRSFCSAIKIQSTNFSEIVFIPNSSLKIILTISRLNCNLSTIILTVIYSIGPYYISHYSNINIHHSWFWQSTSRIVHYIFSPIFQSLMLLKYTLRFHRVFTKWHLQ